MKKSILFIFISIALIFSSCSDDGVSNNEEEHVDAVGMRIVSSGVTIVSYIRDEAVTGEIEVEEGVLTSHMEIEFYDDEKEDWVAPGDEHFSLKIEVADTNIAQYWQHEGEEGGFDFHIRGKEHGETTVVFKLEHEGHFDFVSKAIHIHVEEGDGHAGEIPEGIHLIKEATGDTLVSWDEHDGIEGDPIPVANQTESGHIEVAFFSHDGDALTLNQTEFFLSFAVADTNIATIEQHDTTNEPWAFEVEGLSVGSTTFTIKLLENHGDHNDTIFTTADFTINVQ